MNVTITLDDKELNMFMGMMVKLDPMGYFTGALQEKIKLQYQEYMTKVARNSDLDPKDIDMITKLERDIKDEGMQSSGFTGHKE